MNSLRLSLPGNPLYVVAPNGISMRLIPGALAEFGRIVGDQ